MTLTLTRIPTPRPASVSRPKTRRPLHPRRHHDRLRRALRIPLQMFELQMTELTFSVRKVPQRTTMMLRA